ncbi:MAG TPA: hypothetical protein P5337_09515 [Aestuariivirga sp.]|nr:hypothetical protein [Aestuariivirga sp.]
MAGETIRYEDSDLLIEDNLRAAYDLKTRTVQIVAPWDGRLLEDQSVLLHELIHDVQFHNRRWDCPRQPEFEAYSLQAKWLVRNAPRRNRLGEAITHQLIDERATYLTFDGSIKSQVALMEHGRHVPFDLAQIFIRSRCPRPHP